jgi:hypothetical protein
MTVWSNLWLSAAFRRLWELEFCSDFHDLIADQQLLSVTPDEQRFRKTLLTSSELHLINFARLYPLNHLKINHGLKVGRPES